ncbi:hypothetical protein MMC10_008793 [Thelotrema lepadinum]|nr:hypothetical protein [Thelotrema lepadinum]
MPNDNVVQYPMAFVTLLLIGLPTCIFFWRVPFLRRLLNPFIGDRAMTARRSDGSTATTATGHRRLKQRPFPNGTASTSSPPSPSAVTAQPFKPAVVDVLRLRQYLLLASSNRLPIHLIDEIIDHAEYWVSVSASKNSSLVARGNTNYSDVLVIRTPPICSLATHGSEHDQLSLPEPSLKHPARKVVFTIRSHDQGWSGEPRDTRGTYRNSFTWFDAQIDKQFRPIPHDAPLSSVPWELSSTRFLEAWPEHKHQTDEGEQAQETAINAPANPAAGGSLETHGTPQGQNQDEDESEGVNQSQGQGEHSAGDTELATPRLFSNAYLQNHKYEIQYNSQAHRETREHRIEWRWTDNTPDEGPGADALRDMGRGVATGDGRFVKELRLGDCVSLWAKARYPAWENYVEGAEVEVYFAL